MKYLSCVILIVAHGYAATLSSITNVHYGAPDGLSAHGCSYLVDTQGPLNTSPCGTGVYNAPVGSGFPDIVTNWHVGGSTFATYGVLGASMVLTGDGNYDQEVGSLSAIVTASFSDKLTITSSLPAFSVVQFTPTFTVTGTVVDTLTGNLQDTESRQFTINDASGSQTFTNLLPGVYVGPTVSVFTNQAFTFSATLQLSNSLVHGQPNGSGPFGILGTPFSFNMATDFLDPVQLTGIAITKGGLPVADFQLTSQSGTDYLSVISQANGVPEPATVSMMAITAAAAAIVRFRTHRRSRC